MERSSVKIVELIGGPLDGAAIDVAQPPVYMVIASHQERPVYRAARCSGCGQHKQTASYYFLGYEEEIAYAHPRQAKSLEAVQHGNYVPDSEARR